MVKKQTVTARDGVFRLHLDHPPTQDDLAAEARLRRFGTPAGWRGIGSLVWWPARGTSVRVSTFQVKWNPPVAPDLFAVSLTSKTNEVLWSAEQVDSAQAGLSTAQDSAIKTILLARQNDVKPERLTLTVTSKAQGALATEFTLLSKQEEANVDGKLQVAELEDDSILRIVRSRYTEVRRLALRTSWGARRSAEDLTW